MNPPRFSRLRERLLRAGLAPRHVQRYLRELREHHEDLVRAELAAGAERATAERTAWRRLGTEEDLERSVLAQPELRSITARFPALTLGAGPVAAWLAIVAALFVLVRSAASAMGSEPSLQRFVVPAAYALCVSCVRVLPVTLGAAMVLVAIRQRTRLDWPFVGAALVNVLSGTVSVNRFPPALGESEQLGVSSSLLPLVVPFSDVFGPADLRALTEGLARTAFMLALTWSPYVVWRCRSWLPTNQ